MKRILKLFLVFIFLSIVLTTCDEDECATCYLVTYEDDQETSRDSGVEYCGTELSMKRLSVPVTIGNTTTKYECD